MNQVIFYFTHLLSTEGLPPRWNCGLWSPFQGWFYILSDLGIWAAYFTIPAVLLLFIRKRSDLPFPKIFWLFAAFIFACGTTHLLDALMFWWPAYRLSGLIYFATAGISWVTVFALLPVIPQALSLKSSEDLEKTILERTQALEEQSNALLESESRMRAILENTVDAIITIDEQAQILSFNQAATRLFGYEPDEVLGQNVNLLMPAPYHEEHDMYLANYQKTGIKKIIGIGREVTAKHKEGSTFPIELTISEVQLKDQRIFTGIIRDITERKNAEARKLSILETTADAVITIDEYSIIQEWNPAAEKILGYTRDEVLGSSMARLIIPERYRDAHFQGITHYLATGEGPALNHLLELPALRKDGLEFLAEMTIARVPLAGAPLFTGTLRDITQRKQVEQALAESEERFRVMANSAPVLIWMAGPDTRYTYFNKRWLVFTGRTLEQVVGDGWLEDVYEEDRGDCQGAYAKACQEHQSFEREYRLRQRDGQYRWMLDQGTPRLSPDGEFQGYIGSCIDITERKQLKEELERLVSERTVQLQTVNKELEAFSYSVSHDLRAPLRGIDGFSQVLLEQYSDKLDEQGRHYLSRVRQGSQQMGKLIDDMLQLSRLTRGDMTIEPTDLSVIALNILQTLQEQQPARQVECIIADHVMVYGDKNLLQGVLQNLLDNAWKYTSRHPSAQIEFGVTEQAGGQPVYFVKDDGAGFNMKYAGKLFGAFQRLHGAAEFPGTGVGLATVARIIHRHGGEIWAEAEVEQGATFYFTLGTVAEGIQYEIPSTEGDFAGRR